MLAGMSGNAMLAISHDEAEQLGKASARVLAHYDVPGLKQETLDWINLGQVLCMVYGTRIFAARSMPRSPHQARASAPTGEQAPQSAPSPRAAARGGFTVVTPGLQPIVMPDPFGR